MYHFVKKAATMNSVTFNHQKTEPSKVVCIGRNYVEHIEELGNEIPENMVVFNKPNSAITDTLHYYSESCRFEGEICFLIIDGKIDAVGFGLDLTHADIQNKLKEKGLPWERAKSFDGSAVLSEFVSLSHDIKTLHMKLYINGTLTQFANYDLMMYKPDVMLSEIESFMHLEDGYVIMAGTPKGVDTYALNDTFLGQIYANEVLLLEQEWVVRKEGES